MKEGRREAVLLFSGKSMSFLEKILIFGRKSEFMP